jgi:hypothetical protein
MMAIITTIATLLLLWQPIQLLHILPAPKGRLKEEEPMEW